MKNENNRIFYLGIPAHANLGDLAQGVCIRRWLKKHYPDRRVVEIETNALVNTKFSVLKQFKAVYKKGDIIVFFKADTQQQISVVLQMKCIAR